MRAGSQPGPAGRVLLLSPVDPTAATGGRAMLSRINLLLLRDLFGEGLVHVRPPHAASRLRDAWRGYVDGVDGALIAALIATVDAHDIGQLFVDGSNYGAAVAALKRVRPQVRVVTFFHNVEARFFWGAMRARRSLKSVAVLVANAIAERLAVKHSDVLVTLSERDSAGLRGLYGRRADAIAPIVLEDKRPAAPGVAAEPAGRYLLFVGGGFYANIAGIRWFAREVAPRVPIEIRVVGRGMDALAPLFATIANVTLVGSVDDLAPCYAGAIAVVAPIFDGSGMKTKVAEALMFGKHVVGTPEAFSGYADDVVRANARCVDADGFVAAIGAIAATPPPPFDPAMRPLYDRDHSLAAGQDRLARIMGLTVQASVS